MIPHEAIFKIGDATLEERYKERHSIGTPDNKKLLETVSDLKKKLQQEQSAEKPNQYRLAFLYWDLADAYIKLNNLSDAVPFLEQAVQLFWKLMYSESDDVDVLPALANCLKTLGVCLSSLGQYQDAVGFAAEAVRYYRKLRDTNPQNPDYPLLLAESLDSLTTILSNLALWEKAQETAQELVDIYKQLAEVSPKTFFPRVAKALRVLSEIYYAQERKEEALAAYMESVAYDFC